MGAQSVILVTAKAEPSKPSMSPVCHNNFPYNTATLPSNEFVIPIVTINI